MSLPQVTTGAEIRMMLISSASPHALRWDDWTWRSRGRRWSPVERGARRFIDVLINDMRQVRKPR